MKRNGDNYSQWVCTRTTYFGNTKQDDKEVQGKRGYKSIKMTICFDEN